MNRRKHDLSYSVDPADRVLEGNKDVVPVSGRDGMTICSADFVD